MEHEQPAPPAPAPISNMKTSTAIDKIVVALALVQGSIANPDANKSNTHFNSKYADLAGGLEVIRPALSAEKCVLLQIPTITAEKTLVLVTRIAHESGQWIEGEYPVCPLGKSHHEMGSAMNYAKRQSAFAMVGIAADTDDDDGNLASNAQPGGQGGRGRNQARTPARQSEPVDPLTPEASKAAADKMLGEIAKLESRDDDLKWANANSSLKPQLQKADADRVTAAFAARKRERNAAQQKEAA